VPIRVDLKLALIPPRTEGPVGEVGTRYAAAAFPLWSHLLRYPATVVRASLFHCRRSTRFMNAALMQMVET